MAVSALSAGFLSSADDLLDLDLSRRFARRPFVFKASGQSLLGLGIHPGDFMIVHRSRQPSHSDVVWSFTAKQFRTDNAGHHPRRQSRLLKRR